MAYKGDWTQEHKDKLLKLWEESGKDRAKFEEVCLSDPEFSQISWNACDMKARRMGFYEGTSHQRATLSKEPPEKLAEIDNDLANSEMSWPEMLRKYSPHTKTQFGNYARRKGIKINKGRSAGSEKEYEKRLAELINEGVLIKLGIGGVLKIIKAELPEATDGLTLKDFREKVEEFVWEADEGAHSLLKEFVREGRELTPVYKRLSHNIPRAIVDVEAKKLRGKRPGGTKKKSTMFEAGIGRIATDGEVEQIQKKGIVKLRGHTLSSPFKIPVKDPNNPRVLIINGPHLGLEYNRVFDENTLRNVFRHAQGVGADAIFITAGLMWTDIKKSSGRLTTHRALYHGLDFEPDVMDPDYRAEAIEIRKNQPPDRIGFTTLRERVMNAFGGWNKVTRHTKTGLPIFEGPVFFSFGFPEEEMIENAAHEHLRYLKVCMELDARAERKAAEAELVYELRNSGGEETKEVKRLREKVARLLRLEKRKSANTNIDKLEHSRFVNIIRTLLISWYQEAIPNSQFVGQGTVVCDIGGDKVEVLQADHERPTERDIAKLIRSVGQRDLSGTLPDVILGAGAYNLNSRWSARECMRGTEMEQVQIWQLPVLIDRDYVHEARAELIKKGSPIERLVTESRFEPGAFMLNKVNGVWNSYPLPIAMFTQRSPKKRVNLNEPKEIILYVEGDQHTGSINKEHVWDERSQTYLPMEVAVSELFMREFVEKGRPLPFHIFSSHGDSTQGHHFPTEQNRHPQHESSGILEAESAELLRKIRDGELKPNELKESSAQIIVRLNHQMRLRGEHWYQQQLEDFVDHSLERRAKFFLEILKRGKLAGIQIRGIQQVLTGNENAWDRRDIGLENILDGNHGLKTTMGTVAESWFFARILLLSVLAEKDCPFTREELTRFIRAPIFGPVASGYGLVSISGGYEWGLHLRHDPTRKSGQDGDPLVGATKNLAERGDYGLIFNRRNFITVVGDQHRYAAAYAPGKVVFNCACGTHGDSYGDDWGFSRSNLGNLIICIPADGPGAGPIRMIPISHVFIRRFMRKPWEIDWDKLFPNPA